MRGVSMKNENKKQKLATAGENTKTLTATFIDYWKLINSNSETQPAY